MNYKIIILSFFLTFSFGNSNMRIPGDINNDGVVDVLDVIELVNMILNNSNYTENADLNADGIINVVDIVELVNIVLNRFSLCVLIFFTRRPNLRLRSLTFLPRKRRLRIA